MLTRREWAVGLAGAAASVGTSLARVGLDSGDRMDAWIVGASALAGFSLAFWNRSPRTGWVLATLACAPGFPHGLPLVGYLIVLAYVLQAARRDTTAGGLIAMAAQVVPFVVAGIVHGDSIAIYTFMPETAWATGRVLRDRDRVLARLGERARELEDEREAYAALSVRYERARVASELHDIVAHAISVMVVQAGAGQRLVRVDPALAREAFAAIADSAAQAEQDMGRLIALLGVQEAIGPAPDLHLVEELVARAAGSGLDVRLRLEGDREGLPAELAEVAYRVVQESLTNALRYASGAAVQIVVRGEPAGLAVEAVNGPAAAHVALAGSGTGHGLQGLRERVGACGGRLEAGPTADGGWRLAARLPRRVVALAA